MEEEKTIVLGKPTALFIVEYSQHWYGGSGEIEISIFLLSWLPSSYISA